MKSFFAFLGVTLFVFILLEAVSYGVLKYRFEIDPLNTRQEIYGRKISGYYVSRNSPGFGFESHDGNNGFKQNTTTTDSNGFVNDGPVTIDKPANVTRIFLIGGSTAFGYIQDHDAVNDNTYPDGMYDYASGICGLLKANLQKKFPGKKFEVINAAIPIHMFHQGYLQYLSLIQQFKPDIVINMDGVNDGGGIISGNSFDCAEEELNDFINLKAKEPDRWPFSRFLGRYLLDRYTAENYHSATTKPAADNSFSLTDYRKVEPVFIERVKTFMWSIASFESQLKLDKVHSIFVLQPMLLRAGKQKKLSALEKKFLKNTEQDEVMDMTDTIIRNMVYQAGGKVYEDSLHAKASLITTIMKRYFFEEYFAPTVDSMVRLTGNDFIDMNREIAGLTAADEFYTDHCHLTPFGNAFVANVLANHVQVYLNTGKGQ